MISEAKSADQKDVIVSAELHFAVSSSIAALMTQRNNPALKITAGSVRIFISEPRKVLITENRSATQR
jgi:hypothetical protein